MMVVCKVFSIAADMGYETTIKKGGNNDRSKWRRKTTYSTV